MYTERYGHGKIEVTKNNAAFPCSNSLSSPREELKPSLVSRITGTLGLLTGYLKNGYSCIIVFV